MPDTEGVTPRTANKETIAELLPEARGNIGFARIAISTITVYPRYIDANGEYFYGGISAKYNFVNPNNSSVSTKLSVAQQNRLLAYLETNGYTFNGWVVTVDYTVHNEDMPASRMSIVERRPSASKTSTYVGFTSQKIISVGPENPKNPIFWDGYLEYTKTATLSTAFNAWVYFAE